MAPAGVETFLLLSSAPHFAEGVPETTELSPSAVPLHTSPAAYENDLHLLMLSFEMGCSALEPFHVLINI